MIVGVPIYRQELSTGTRNKFPMASLTLFVDFIWQKCFIEPTMRSTILILLQNSRLAEVHSSLRDVHIGKLKINSDQSEWNGT